MSEAFNELVKKRGILKAKLTRFQTFLSTFTDDSDILSLTVRLENLHETFKEFDSIQTSIEMTDINDPEIIAEREAFEDQYYESVAKSKRLIANRTNSDKPEAPKTGKVNEQSEVKLPRIELPSFYGSYNQWTHFYETFYSLIHNNNKLSDVQKLHYLKSCLKGEASQILSSLEITCSNYTIAWDLLKERFDNKKLIINSHIKSIFDLPYLKSESHTNLRKLLDGFNKNVRALTSLGQPTQHWDTLLLYIVVSKLDIETKKEWEKITCGKESPTISEFQEFLAKRSQLLESTDTNNKNTKSINKSNEVKTLTHLATNKSNKITCSFCKESHFNNTCDKFSKMSIEERRQNVKLNKHCFNCLRPNHLINDCKSSGCKYCSKKHHSLLHEENVASTIAAPSVESIEDNTNSENPSSSIISTLSSNHAYSNSHQTILPTAVVYLRDQNGDKFPCRCLLDTGSMSNFMTASLAKKLNLKINKIDISVSGINCSSSNVKGKVNAIIYSNDESYYSNQSFLVVTQITENMPLVTFDNSKISIPKNILLSDEKYFECRPIDMLLGVNVVFDIICEGKYKLNDNNITLQNTYLGWIISGEIPHYYLPITKCHLAISNDILSEQIERFWLQEENQTTKRLSNEESSCEEHFKTNVTRNETGRFQVRLPFHDNYLNLGDSKDTALRCFYNLEKRLSKHPQLKQLYTNFMREYEDLNHMTAIDSADISNIKYILPHHGILKENSSTTRLRVVFNGSSKTTQDLSLNDVLKVGPKIQRDLLSILLSFRTYNYVFCADIEKMYRQVNIAPCDRYYQCIVWRLDPSNQLKYYTLNTVTYGTSSASFLAIRSLYELAITNKHLYPEACHIIENDFYVDDLLSGANTIEDAIRLKNQVTCILNSGGFPLRKWKSNSRQILISSQDECIIEFDKSDNYSNTLGLSWNCNSDKLNYTLKIDKSNLPTKRSILSSISKIFDPLGLLGPITVRGKLIIQRLWREKLNWDDEIPEEIQIIWTQFNKSLQDINLISIPRQVTAHDYFHIELHGFCDSSETMYGACLYIRTKTSDGSYTVHLLCSKSRLAPLKTISLPKLELCGALLLAKLTNTTLKDIGLTFNKIVFWCDSTIVLSWINSEPNHWKTYVANRIAEIQQLTRNNCWRHVPTNLNPADIISRGATPKQICDSKLWFNRPDFLYNDESSWPNTIIDYSNNQTERRKPIKSVFISYNDISIFDRYNSFEKLQRIFAYVLRFINNTKGNTTKIKSCLTNDAMEDWKNRIVETHPEQDDIIRVVSVKLTNRNLIRRSVTKCCPLPIE